MSDRDCIREVEDGSQGEVVVGSVNDLLEVYREYQCIVGCEHLDVPNEPMET